MKRIIVFLLSASIFVFSFCGCNSKENTNHVKISQGAQKAADKTIEYVDAFIDFDMEAKEASEKINAISKNTVFLEENDSLVDSEISLCSYYIEDFIDEAYIDDDLDRTRASNRLINIRNSLAYNSGNNIRKFSSYDITKYNLAELCINRNLMEHSFVTTTISTKNIVKIDDCYIASFTLKDKKSFTINIYTYGLCSDLKNNDYVTLTGVFDYNETSESLSINLYAANDSFLSKKENKELYTDITKYDSVSLLYDKIKGYNDGIE